MSPLRRITLRALPLLAWAASAPAWADAAADYQRSLQAVAEIDGVVVKIEEIAHRRKGRRPAEVQACLDDKVAEARKLQKLAGDHHGRMVEAMADRKAAAAWDSYRSVAQLQAQARKLAGGAEGCRMLGSAESAAYVAPRPAPAAPARAAAAEPGAPAGQAPAAGSPTTAALSAATVGAVELELD